MAAKKKLAIILANYFEQCSGGAELQAYYLAKIASENNWEVYYIFISNGNPYKNTLNINLLPIPKSKIASKLGNIKYVYFFHLWKTLKKIKPDTIYQRSASALTGISVLYAKSKNINMSYHIASDEDLNTKYSTNVFRIVERLFASFGQKQASTVIAQTNKQALLFKATYDKPVSAVISNGHPLPNKSMAKNDEICIVWIGNMKPLKQPEIFIDLATELRKKHKVKCVMIGRWDNYSKLVQDSVNDGKIIATGELTNDEVNRILEQSHVLVNTSKYEGFSNTFIQAWMRSIPVVSLNVNPDSVITDNNIGYYSEHYSQLVKDIKTLITNEDIRNTMAKNSEKFSASNYSLENIKLLLEVINNK